MIEMLIEIVCSAVINELKRQTILMYLMAIELPNHLLLEEHFKTVPKAGFPVMAEISCILAANIHRQFFFVIAIEASTRCLVENFQLIDLSRVA